MSRRALLDVNVLLALAWPNHQHHAAAHRWFAADGSRGWASCAFTQLAFARLSSNPAYTEAAVSPTTAGGLLEELTAHPGHEFWERCPPLSGRLLAAALGHRQINDAYLLEMASVHDGRLATFDQRLRGLAGDASHLHVIAVT